MDKYIIVTTLCNKEEIAKLINTCQTIYQQVINNI